MNQVVTIGLDIAKSVFQLHGVDAAGAVLLRKRLTRSRMLAFFEKQAPCLIGIEACGSAHYWGARAEPIGPRRSLDPAELREAVRQTAEERCSRRGSDLRSGDAARACGSCRSNRLSSKASWLRIGRDRF